MSNTATTYTFFQAPVVKAVRAYCPKCRSEGRDGRPVKRRWHSKDRDVWRALYQCPACMIEFMVETN